MENKNKNKETKEPELTKNNCQNAIRDVEDAVFRYKNSFPNSVSECVRNSAKYYLWLMALGSILLMIFQPLMAHGFILFMCVIGAIGVGQDLSRKESYNFDYKYEKSLLKYLAPYAEFPDIKRYIDSIEPTLKLAQKRKIRLKRMGTAVNVLAFVAVAGFLTHILVNESSYFRDDVENIHPGDGIGIFSQLPSYYNMEPHKPFVSIKPLEGSGLTENLDLFVENRGEAKNFSDYSMYICYLRPEGGSLNKYVITDKQGNFSIFEDFDNYSDGVYTLYLGTEEGLVINKLNYLYTHADELRYKQRYERENDQQ